MGFLQRFTEAHAYGYTGDRFLYGFSNHVVTLLRIAKFPLLTVDLTLVDGDGVVVVGNW